MDTGNNDIKHYTAEDISRYWQGKLSPQEMRAMEIAAMDDPFLADAMEGYSNAQPENITASIRDLHNRLNERTGAVVSMRRKRRWLSIAAAIILLCGSGIVTYTWLVQNDSATNKLTQAEPTGEHEKEKLLLQPQTQQDTLTSNTAGNSTSDTAAGLKDTYASAGKQPNETPQTVAATQNTWQSTADTTAVVSNKLADASKDGLISSRKPDQTLRYTSEKKVTQPLDTLFIASNETNRKTSDLLQGKVEGLSNRNAPANITLPPARKDNEADRFLSLNNFRGRVLDNRNEPIPNATIRNNSATITATDQQGNFQIRSFDSVLNLSVSSVGYEPRQLTMRNNQPQDVVLDDANKKSLEQVVVTGYGNQKKRDKAESRTTSSAKLKVFVIDAEPVVGWDEYNRYIEENKRIDSTAGGVKGEVVVAFTVSKTGKLSNFTIEKSFGKQYDAEAIRLIKEGPAWKVLKNKKTRGQIIIPF
ncbi:MAG TPA: carboxypeptidase-like regulatory domain-containing protein [Chitinophagaceae bacterium]|nr:carboxypeptidase-like regulatory domain-containing protein [Chitinophagaceae bacterium]